jgi:hypothetical protein
MKILALDLGKFNSVSCFYNPQTRLPHATTIKLSGRLILPRRHEDHEGVRQRNAGWRELQNRIFVLFVPSVVTRSASENARDNFLGAARPAWNLPHSVADSKPFFAQARMRIFFAFYLKNNFAS